MGAPPPPYGYMEGQYYGGGGYRNIPRYPAYQKRSACGGCCRCICCCFCVIILLILICLAAFGILFAIVNPKLPQYKTESFMIKSFQLSGQSLSASVEINVKADNPNKKISLQYGSDAWINISYSNVMLCSGRIPSFEQGTDNITTIKIQATGNPTLGPDVQKSLDEAQKNKRIPLDISAKFVVAPIIFKAKLKGLTAFVNTTAVVDNLSPNANIKVDAKDGKFKTKLYFGKIF